MLPKNHLMVYKSHHIFKSLRKAIEIGLLNSKMKARSSLIAKLCLEITIEISFLKQITRLGTSDPEEVSLKPLQLNLLNLVSEMEIWVSLSPQERIRQIQEAQAVSPACTISSIGTSNSIIVTFTLLIKTKKDLILSKVGQVHAVTTVHRVQMLFHIQDKWVQVALNNLGYCRKHHYHCTKFKEWFLDNDHIYSDDLIRFNYIT